MNEDMFEKFVNNKLPPEIKAQLECCADVHAGNNSNKWWFTVGFFYGYADRRDKKGVRN